MSRLAPKFWLAVGLVITLDFLIYAQIASFIRQLGYGGWCGTWAVVIGMKMNILGLVSLPVGFIAWRFDRLGRRQLSRVSHFCARMSVCCLVGQLVTWFVALPILSRLM